MPLTPVENGRFVQFARLPEAGVPRIGVVSDGELENTRGPVPVSPVTAAARFAELGVARKVATPVPSPLRPEATGRPVQFVSVPLAGVPSAGVLLRFKVPEESDKLLPMLISSAAPVAAVVRPRILAVARVSPAAV